MSSEYPIEPVARAADPIGPGVHIGHVHLRTADTARVRAFYVDILGFDVIAEASDVPGWGTTGDILFVSAGGYHHHLAFNTWKSKDGGRRRTATRASTTSRSPTPLVGSSQTPTAASSRPTGRSAHRSPTRRTTRSTARPRRQHARADVGPADGVVAADAGRAPRARSRRGSRPRRPPARARLSVGAPPDRGDSHRGEERLRESADGRGNAGVRAGARARSSRCRARELGGRQTCCAGIAPVRRPQAAAPRPRRGRRPAHRREGHAGRQRSRLPDGPPRPQAANPRRRGSARSGRRDGEPRGGSLRVRLAGGHVVDRDEHRRPDARRVEPAHGPGGSRRSSRRPTAVRSRRAAAGARARPVRG